MCQYIVTHDPFGGDIEVYPGKHKRGVSVRPRFGPNLFEQQRRRRIIKFKSTHSKAETSRATSIFKCNGRDELDVVLTKFGIELFVRDVRRLNYGKWLNDDVMMMYLRLLVDEATTMYNDVYLFNSHFYEKLLSPSRSKHSKGRKRRRAQVVNYDNVARWTKNIDILNKRCEIHCVTVCVFVSLCYTAHITMSLLACVLHQIDLDSDQCWQHPLGVDSADQARSQKVQVGFDVA